MSVPEPTKKEPELKKPEKEEPDLSKYSDDELLREAVNGNSAAYSKFVVRSIPTISRYIYWYCKNNAIPSDLADDIIQETLIKAIVFLRGVVGYRLPKLSSSWLITIAHNAAVDWIRKNRRMKFIDPLIMSRIEAAPTEEEIKSLEQVLDKYSWLRVEEQEILELILLKEYGFAEAADELAISEAAAKKRYYRAIERLRDLTDEHGGAE